MGHKHWVAAIAAALGGLIGSVAQAADHLILPTYPNDPPMVEATHQVAGAKFLYEFIPQGETLENYRTILSAKSFPGTTSAGPEDFLKGMFARSSAACDGVRVNGPKSAEEGRASVAYGQVYCGRQKGKPYGVNMFFKVIQGRDALYVIHVEFHVPPSSTGGVQAFSQDQVTEMVAMLKAQSAANTYLVESVFLCLDGSTDPRCQAAAKN
ncbi:MAG TPA: hypothetical protein VG407_17090 [Caulobacteraceae bacterium]|jgi:hypothetical protein|nr:hypothetical protein [Caulobacteraceae bacterium]